MKITDELKNYFQNTPVEEVLMEMAQIIKEDNTPLTTSINKLTPAHVWAAAYVMGELSLEEIETKIMVGEQLPLNQKYIYDSWQSDQMEFKMYDGTIEMSTKNFEWNILKSGRQLLVVVTNQERHKILDAMVDAYIHCAYEYIPFKVLDKYALSIVKDRIRIGFSNKHLDTTDPTNLGFECIDSVEIENETYYVWEVK